MKEIEITPDKVALSIKDYYITKSGEVYSTKKGSLRLLKPGGSRYRHVCLITNIGPVTITVHRLVATTFIPNPNNLPFINHKNGDKTDNRVENLEWCTQSYNQDHAYKLGLQKPQKGEDNACAKLTKAAVALIRSDTTSSQNELAKRFSVAQPTIWRIKHNVRWVV